jgi:hypothetical protein
MKWLKNQLRSRRVQPVSHRLGTDVQRMPPQQRQHLPLVLSPLFVVVNGVSVCLNTGTCKNIRTPPETMGKGKGSGKGMTTQELLERYEDMAKTVDASVDLTGRGRRTDGTRAPDLLAIGWRSVCSRFAASVCQCYHCHG